VTDQASVVPLSTRARRAAAFVAIVWGIAATFVAFEIVAARGIDFALGYPRLFGPLLLSPATRDSTACTVGANDTPAARNDTLSGADARAASWMLGNRVGNDAQAGMSPTVTRDVLDQSAEGIVKLAALVGTTAPERFRPARIVNGNTEFRNWIETDPHGTAHRLAVNYSPEACRLYKLGALWGYSTMARSALGGERSLFAVEIDHHARAAGLPENVWHPMVERIPAGATPEEINAQSRTQTARVTEHLMKGR
jgi:hypothetical protein